MQIGMINPMMIHHMAQQQMAQQQMQFTAIGNNESCSQSYDSSSHDGLIKIMQHIKESMSPSDLNFSQVMSFMSTIPDPSHADKATWLQRAKDIIPGKSVLLAHLAKYLQLRSIYSFD